MKIPVRNENQSVFNATVVKIKDLSSGLEKITVRALKKRIRIPVKVAEEDKPTARTAAATEKEAPSSLPTETQSEATPAPKAKKKAFTLSRPTISPLKALAKPVRRAPRTTAVAGVVLLAATSVYVIGLPQNPDVGGNIKGASTANSAPTLEYGTPDFKTILPDGKDIEQLGGWVRVSPPERDPVYAFTDTLGNVQVAVSEQPIPDEFGEDPEAHLSKVAGEFGTTEKITVEGTTVHIGTSAKGPQSVLFTKEDLLVLIKSTESIDNNQWAVYIESLR